MSSTVTVTMPAAVVIVAPPVAAFIQGEITSAAHSQQERNDD